MNKYILPAAAAGFLIGAGFGYANRDKIKQHVGYAGYLLPHKWYTGKAMLEMNLPLVQAITHDSTKFRPSEWSAYSAWFNGPEGLQGAKDPKLYMQWRDVVQQHYHRNPHHWRALHKHPKDVPTKYKLEAIADWYGVNRAKGLTNKSFKDWFEERKNRFPIDKGTIMDAEQRLKIAAKKENKYTSLEYTIASGDPLVKALTRNMAVDKQKAVWKRYAQIVLRNRNYGRSAKVPGEYIKNKESTHV
jgi:hypothetical protein